MTHRPWSAALLISLCGAAMPLHGQEPDRDARVAQALQSFDFAEAVELLMPVLDPGLAGTDSLWSAGVKAMATVLLDGGLDNAASDPDLAALWLRWGVRVGGSLPLDPVYDLEAVRAAYSDARDAVGGPDDLEAPVETQWEWAAAFDPQAQGRLLVDVPGAEGGAMEIVVDGRRYGVAEVATLAPGTYRIEVEGGAYESVAFEREILPGITTRVRVEPLPALPDEVRSAADPWVVQLAFADGGSRVCTNGLALGRSAVVARPATVSRQELDLVSGTGSLTGPSRVSESDGIGVALASLAAQGPWPEFGVAQVDQHAWALYRAGCGGPLLDERVRVAAQDQTEIVFDRSVATAAVGGALVDRSGAVLGVVSAVDRATVLTSQAQLFLEQAILAMNEASRPDDPPQSSGGGMPWKWVGGAGAAGALALVLLSGGNPPGPDGPSTGEIIVVVPGG